MKETNFKLHMGLNSIIHFSSTEAQYTALQLVDQMIEDSKTVNGDNFSAKVFCLLPRDTQFGNLKNHLNFYRVESVLTPRPKPVHPHLDVVVYYGVRNEDLSAFESGTVFVQLLNPCRADVNEWHALGNTLLIP